jgi:hypothetical protein
MTAPGYLDRLAARARGAGAAGGLHPRVPGRYEPAGLAGAQGPEVAAEVGLATTRRGAPPLAEPSAEAWTGAWPAEEPEWVERGSAPEAGPPGRLDRRDPHAGMTVRAGQPDADTQTWDRAVPDWLPDATRMDEETADESAGAAGHRGERAASTSTRAAAGQLPAGRRAASQRAAGSRPTADVQQSSPPDALADWAEERSARAATAGDREAGRASAEARNATAASRATEPGTDRAAATAGDEPSPQAPPGPAASWLEARQPLPPGDGAAGGVGPPGPAARPGAAAEVAAREIVVRPETGGPAALGPAVVTAETEAPVIEVTIGRVEVRAAPAGDDPRRRRARERERPPMPLDEYLRRRRAGR